MPALSGRHRATVRAICEKPTRSDVSWTSFAAPVSALGGSITRGRGSRRRIVVGTRRANLHEPHPSPNMAKGAVEDARDFLRLLGVNP
jgi:hypothetical protein